MIFEKSCGAIVYTIENMEIKYLLVEEMSGFHSFPKGHMEGEETEEETALREITVEKPGFTKQVVYFLAEYSDETPIVVRPDEVRSLKSLSF